MGLKKIGAMWKKQGKRGEFLTGQVEVDGKKVDFVVFPNDRKESEKQPDFVINIRTDDVPAPQDGGGMFG
jgi:uncharacterized protein (DUF736 family)